MESYYNVQASSSIPHFSGHYRQRGSGFGALAAGIGRVALPIAKKFILPAAKRIGREFLLQAAPEMINIATKQKTPKQAMRSAVSQTARKQFGGAYSKRRPKVIHSQRKPRQAPQKRKPPSVISRKTKSKRSRSDFFSRVKNAV